MNISNKYISNTMNNHNNEITNKKQKTTNNKLQLPTKDEQKQLQQIDILMKTNILQLKIESLLSEVSADRIFLKNQVQNWIESVKSIINTEKNIKLNENWMIKQGFKGLELHNKNDSSLEFTYTKPHNVDVIGSTVYKTTTNPILNIDLSITIPTEIFDKRDILNHRYFDKRKLYLASIYKLLSKSKELYEDIHIKSFKGDSRKPIIVITAPFKKAGTSIVIKLIPVISETTFKTIQLRANKNNVRPPHWNDNSNICEQKDVTNLVPTPLYNLAILEDMVLLIHHLIIQKILTCSSLSQAIVLFKIWLTQRGFRFTVDGFDGHHASLLLAYLVQTKRVSSNNSALNIFQTMLTFIAEGHLIKSKLDFTKSEMSTYSTFSIGEKDDSMINVSEKIKHNSILTDDMWDFMRPLVLNHPVAGDSIYNCFWRISSSSANMLQYEASRCLKELQCNQDSSCFDLLFMSPRSFFESHDYFYHIPIDLKSIPYLEDSSKPISRKDLENNPRLIHLQGMSDQQRVKLGEMLAHCLPYQYISSNAVALVSKAIGDRAVAVHSFIRSIPPEHLNEESIKESQHTSSVQLSDNFPSWRIDEEDLSSKSNYIITIGIILDKEKMDRRVEKGPINIDGAAITDIAADPAADPAAASFITNSSNTENKLEELTKFRDFWGSKVELRRFKDGSIIEAVVWDTQSVIDQVVKYILGKHLAIVCGDQGQYIRSVSIQLDNILTMVSPGGLSDATARLANTALDSLRGILTSKIKELPLALENVSAISPSLRYTALNAIAPHPIVLADKGSTKNAIANIKSSSTCKMIKSMLKKYAGQSISLLCSPLKIIVQIESSGKWPSNDTKAIRYTKTALLLQLKNELTNQFQIVSIIHKDSLDICYEGFIFRVYLAGTDDIEYLLLGDLDEYSSTVVDKSLQESEVYFMKSLSIGRNLKIPPLHHSAIRSLKSQYPSYTGAVRLFTLWIAQHYFTGHICVELIELIVGYEYLNPFSSIPPASAMSGFYRALLRLADHNWETEPLVVDLSGDSKEIIGSAAVGLEIITNFRAARNDTSSILSDENTENSYNTKFLRSMNMPMYVVSSVDKVNKYWPSYQSPERVVLAMMVRLAKESAKKLLSWMQSESPNLTSEVVENNSWELEKLSNLMQSNAVLHKCNYVLKFRKGISNLKPQEGPAFARLDVYANTPMHEATLNSLIVREGEWILNPIQEEFIAKLKTNFQNDALFFWNGMSGSEIGILWRPILNQYSNFSVLSSKYKAIVINKNNNNNDDNNEEKHSSSSSAISNQTQTNFTEILAHIVDMSNGLLEISKIDGY